MALEPLRFFEAIINAGAILAGFCGTFLAFRIQREANYYRQPVLDYEKGKAKDILIGLTHFTSAFLLLILATVCAIVFGFLFPLLALAGLPWALTQVSLVVSGIVASLILLIAYFLDELIHYRVLSRNLVNDAREWGSEKKIVIGALIVALVCAILTYVLI